jgi:hypothetical protein
MAIFNDAQQMHKMYPATFEAPSSDELAPVRVGSLVKICADDLERLTKPSGQGASSKTVR